MLRSQLTSRADFPEAVADLSQGKAWLTEDVEKWMAAHRPHRTEQENDAP